jgi:hypothetical protein
MLLCVCLCLCLYVYPPLLTVEGLRQSAWNLVCIGSKFSGVVSKSLRSVIPIIHTVALITVMLFKRHGTWYIYHAIWAHLNCAIKKPLPSVIPILQLFKLLRKNLYIAWMLLSIIMKLDTYISCYLSPFQWHTSWIPLISNTNTIASQLVEVIFLILFECLNGSSCDLVCIPYHLRPSQRRTS